jgi:acyl carrier protein
MTEESIRRIAIRIIGSIAPEAPVDNLESGRRLRDQIDFDSVDFLNFALALQEELKIRIPEADYPKLATLDGCVDYLLSRIGSLALGDQPQ